MKEEGREEGVTTEKAKERIKRRKRVKKEGMEEGVTTEKGKERRQRRKRGPRREGRSRKRGMTIYRPCFGLTKRRRLELCARIDLV